MSDTVTQRVYYLRFRYDEAHQPIVLSLDGIDGDLRFRIAPPLPTPVTSFFQEHFAKALSVFFFRGHAPRLHLYFPVESFEAKSGLHCATLLVGQPNVLRITSKPTPLGNIIAPAFWAPEPRRRALSDFATQHLQNKMLPVLDIANEHQSAPHRHLKPHSETHLEEVKRDIENTLRQLTTLDVFAQAEDPAWSTIPTSYAQVAPSPEVSNPLLPTDTCRAQLVRTEQHAPWRMHRLSVVHSHLQNKFSFSKIEAHLGHFGPALAEQLTNRLEALVAPHVNVVDPDFAFADPYFCVRGLHLHGAISPAGRAAIVLSFSRNDSLPNMLRERGLWPEHALPPQDMSTSAMSKQLRLALETSKEALDTCLLPPNAGKAELIGEIANRLRFIVHLLSRSLDHMPTPSLRAAG